MSKSSAGSQTNFLVPHPLAVRLIAELTIPDARVLEIGTGSGRNQRALIAAGARVTAIEAGCRVAPASFDAALSTHALLHGTPATLEAALQQVHAALRPGASLYATFGSKRDARYGAGRRIAAHVFAPEDGDEIGVAHAYWDEPELRVLLEPFELIELIETQVDEIAGSWAHKKKPLAQAYHWMVIARRRP
jgi:cyclopropane fatty-acyl-phospholipid synthase-like methyltransferase